MNCSVALDFALPTCNEDFSNERLNAKLNVNNWSWWWPVFDCEQEIKKYS